MKTKSDAETGATKVDHNTGVIFFLPFSGEWRKRKARARGARRTQDEERVCLMFIFFFYCLLFQ